MELQPGQDCCASGVCTTDEGNGVTELIAACAYNAIANGVGRFSFTHALISRLRMLASLPYFTIGFLYNSLFTEIQSWRIEDSRYKKAPIHLVLSQNNERPRSIRLSSRLRLSKRLFGGTSSDAQVCLERPLNSLSFNNTSSSSSAVSPHHQIPSPDCSWTPSQTTINSERESGLWLSTSPTSPLELPEYPRLLFSIRIQEDVKPTDLSIEMFTDWLRDVPVSSSLVRVEAGFASNSTILMVSMPAAMIAYLPSDPAIIILGVIHSENLLTQRKSAVSHLIGAIKPVKATAKSEPSTPREEAKIVSIPQILEPAVYTRPLPSLPERPIKPRNFPKGRLSVSTIGTTSSGTAQSAYTLFNESSSDGRASIMTSVSSMTTGSQYALVHQVFRPPIHDPINGLWNGILRVIPCNIDHSGQLWDDSFTKSPTCTVCGFSRWHSLMLHAQSIDLAGFKAAMESLDTGFMGFKNGGSPLDYAGNSSAHYLMSAGLNLDYLRQLHWKETERQGIYEQNVFGQNPLHVLNPDSQGHELIRLLEWFKTVPAVKLPPGLLLKQRDIQGRTPLHTLLCRPLHRELYWKILDVFPFTEHQVRTLDVSGRTVIELMQQASLKFNLVSEDEFNKLQNLQNGIADVREYLDRTGGNRMDQEYGFHEIARGAKGTSFPTFYECRICSQVNAHSSSYLDQMKCACERGRDRGAPDSRHSRGLTPAHALITCKRAAPDGSQESPAQTAELFRVLVPPDDPTLLEVLHVLDPEGNSLVHNVAIRGFHEILEYILNLERPSRRRSMVNAYVKHQNREISVLAAVEEELQKISDRNRMMIAIPFQKKDPLRERFLSEMRGQLLEVKQILLNAGAEMNPSFASRWRIT
ncbi:hypothetical protein V8E51_002733 [Hyaloscypha variabilis]